MFRRLAAPIACTALLLSGCQPNQGGEPSASATDPAAAEPAPVASGGDAEGNAAVAVRIGGENISYDEIDELIKEDLFDRQTGGGNPAKLYELRNDAVGDLVYKRVLEGEAARRNLTVDELIDAEVAARGNVTDEEVETFFNENLSQMGERDLAEMSPRIRDYLSQVRHKEAADALVEAADVEILLERPRVEVAAEGPSKGPADAAVTIIEFSDFQCPFCSRALPVVQELLERYPEDVRVVYRHLPLDRIHPWARKAAEAAVCADEQSRFWAYHDLLFANAKSLGDEDLKRLAGEANLDVAAWEACLAEDRVRDKVEADVAAARAIGVTGTPAFVVNGVILSGAKPVQDFIPIIDDEIARAKGGSPSS